jgi:hypothetical protein
LHYARRARAFHGEAADAVAEALVAAGADIDIEDAVSEGNVTYVHLQNPLLSAGTKGFFSIQNRPRFGCFEVLHPLKDLKIFILSSI